jgi:hypothetical protein
LSELSYRGVHNLAPGRDISDINCGNWEKKGMPLNLLSLFLLSFLDFNDAGSVRNVFFGAGKKTTRERSILHVGQTLAETVQTTHRGFTTNEPVELVVFYAGQVGVPITINEE